MLHCAVEHIGQFPLGAGVTGGVGGSGVGGGKAVGDIVHPGTGVRIAGSVTGPAVVLGPGGVGGAGDVDGGTGVGAAVVVMKQMATSQHESHWEVLHGEDEHPSTEGPDVH
jgi:hypothetical protein